MFPIQDGAFGPRQNQTADADHLDPWRQRQDSTSGHHLSPRSYQLFCHVQKFQMPDGRDERRYPIVVASSATAD